MRALRAPHWWYFALLPLASSVDARWPLDVEVSRALASVLAAAACLSFSYGVNGAMDRHMDAAPAKNALVGSDVVPREAIALLGASVVVALACAAWVDRAALVLAFASLVAGAAYSAPPRLKRFPGLGTLVNVAIFAPLPLLATALRPSASVLALELCFCVLLTQNQLLHEVSDAEEDARGGVRTTGVRLGLPGLRAVSLLLGPGAACLFASLPVPALVRALSSVALVVGSVFLWPATEARAARLRVGHRLCSLAFGVALFSLLASTRLR